MTMWARRVSRRTSLDDTFDPRGNALNAIRLVLASLVIVSHAWPLTGVGADPSFGGQTLGSWAVVAFFLISGFLITRSRMNRSAGAYYRDRFLRIYPGYLAAMAATGFVFAPLSTLITGASYDPLVAAKWLIRNLPLYEQHVARASIGDTLTGIPYQTWNGPVWSLFFEAACYVGIGVAVSVLPRRGVTVAVTTAAAGLTAAVFSVKHDAVMVQPIYELALPAVLAFAVGSCVYQFRQRIVVDRPMILASLAVLAVVVTWNEGPTLGAWALVIPIFGLSNMLRVAHAIGRRHDVSYGIYIYGWPVQTLLVVAGREYGWRLPLVLDIALVLSVTLVMAWLSALFVEEPAQRFRARPTYRDRAAPGTVPAVQE